jgi:hypothetical protein
MLIQSPSWFIVAGRHLLRILAIGRNFPAQSPSARLPPEHNHSDGKCADVDFMRDFEYLEHRGQKSSTLMQQQDEQMYESPLDISEQKLFLIARIVVRCTPSRRRRFNSHLAKADALYFGNYY